MEEELRRKADRQLDERLKDIEDQLRSIRDTDMRSILEQLIRLDEQSHARTERVDRHETLIERLDARVTKLERGDIHNSNFISWAERGMWLIIAGLVAWLFEIKR